MIREIWLRIAALLALAVLPIMILQLKLQQDSITLVYDLAEKTDIRPTLDAFLTQLRDDAKMVPEKEATFKQRFLDASITKRSLEEFFLAQSSIDRDIRSQTIWITCIVLSLSLLGSVWISRGIVSRVQKLIVEKEKASAKLRDLAALRNWQDVAKILVHELRAPITPIKLVTTDLAYKYNSLDRDKFSRYLIDAQTLVNEQVEAIEAMIEGFTVFGKLPDPELQKVSLRDFLIDFNAIFGTSFGDGVTLTIESFTSPIEVNLDTKLMRDLIFNLCKNASEANGGVTAIYIRGEVTSEGVLLRIHNTGISIPDSIRKTLFDPYVSTKTGPERTNMGLGLAIARKIAFDHGGDLTLADVDSGVTFELLLPPSSKRLR